MTREGLLRLLSIILLVCVGIVVIIDVAADFRVKVGLRLKWSLLWIFCRYIGSVCAVVLALNILF